jgi:hypothetical protein
MGVKHSLKIREEYRLRLRENMVRRIFLPEGQEVAGRWRRVHVKELRNL